MKKLMTMGLAAVLTGAVLLTGCSARSAKTEPPAAPAAPAKPALTIPESFANDQAKIDFAVKAVNDRYYAEGKKLLEEAMATAPSADGYAKLGTARYNLKDYAGAIEAWTKASELDPSRQAILRTYIGNALRDQGKTADAEAAYRKAMETDPKTWNAAINLATLLNGQGKKADAIAVLEQAAPANPEITPIASLLESYKKDAASNK